jgi:hypothetical protein
VFNGTLLWTGARGKVIAQIMPSESADPSALENLYPRGPKARDDIKHVPSIPRLLAPAQQNAHGFIIQRYMAGLAIFGIATLSSVMEICNGRPESITYRLCIALRRCAICDSPSRK